MHNLSIQTTVTHSPEDESPNVTPIPLDLIFLPEILVTRDLRGISSPNSSTPSVYPGVPGEEEDDSEGRVFLCPRRFERIRYKYDKY